MTLSMCRCRIRVIKGTVLWTSRQLSVLQTPLPSPPLQPPPPIHLPSCTRERHCRFVQAGGGCGANKGDGVCSHFRSSTSLCSTHPERSVGSPQGGCLAATRGGAHQGTQAAFPPFSHFALCHLAFPFCALDPIPSVIFSCPLFGSHHTQAAAGPSD